MTRRDTASKVGAAARLCEREIICCVYDRISEVSLMCNVLNQ